MKGLHGAARLAKLSYIRNMTHRRPAGRYVCVTFAVASKDGMQNEDNRDVSSARRVVRLNQLERTVTVSCERAA